MARHTFAADRQRPLYSTLVLPKHNRQSGGLHAMMQVLHRLPRWMRVFSAHSMHSWGCLVIITRRLALQAMRQSQCMPCMAFCACRRPAAPLARAASIARTYWAVCRRGRPLCRCCRICSMSFIAPAAIILHVWLGCFAPLCGPSCLFHRGTGPGKAPLHDMPQI